MGESFLYFSCKLLKKAMHTQMLLTNFSALIGYMYHGCWHWHTLWKLGFFKYPCLYRLYRYYYHYYNHFKRYKNLAITVQSREATKLGNIVEVWQSWRLQKFVAFTCSQTSKKLFWERLNICSWELWWFSILLERKVNIEAG